MHCVCHLDEKGEPGRSLMKRLSLNSLTASLKPFQALVGAGDPVTLR